jgi:hypothetical protein
MDDDEFGRSARFPSGWYIIPGLIFFIIILWGIT